MARPRLILHPRRDLDAICRLARRDVMRPNKRPELVLSASVVSLMLADVDWRRVLRLERAQRLGRLSYAECAARFSEESTTHVSKATMYRAFRDIRARRAARKEKRAMKKTQATPSILERKS